MALKKECPSCHYRNSAKVRKCRACGASLAGKIVWWVDICFSEKRFVKRVGSYEKAKQLETEVCAQRNSHKTVAVQQSVPRFEEFWPKYLVFCMHRNKDIRNKTSRWNNHLKPFFGRYRLDEVNPMLVEEYRQRRLRRGIKPATINREVSIVRHMVNLAMRWGLLSHNPLHNLGNLPERNENSWHYLSLEEFERLLANISNEYKDITEFLAFSGRRLGEALNLRWKDINFRQRMVFVRHSKSGNGLYFPLTERAFQVLVRRAKEQL